MSINVNDVNKIIRALQAHDEVNGWTDGEPATIADGLFAIANAIVRLAKATEELATAPLMGISQDDILGISGGIYDVAAVLDETTKDE